MKKAINYTFGILAIITLICAMGILLMPTGNNDDLKMFGVAMFEAMAFITLFLISVPKETV